MRYLETITVPVEEPEDYPGNARIHDDEWLDESAETNGQYRAILARRIEGGQLQILAGHGTRAAFRRRGDTNIRVEVIEAADREARRINMVDNPRPGVGGFDHPALLALLDQAKADGGLAGTGWTDDAHDDLMKLLEAPDLDDLADKVGDPTAADGHVVVKVLVEPEVRDRFERLMKLTEEAEESDAFAGVVAWASAGARADGLDVEP